MPRAASRPATPAWLDVAVRWRPSTTARPRSSQSRPRPAAATSAFAVNLTQKSTALPSGRASRPASILASAWAAAGGGGGGSTTAALGGGRPPDAAPVRRKTTRFLGRARVEDVPARWDGAVVRTARAGGRAALDQDAVAGAGGAEGGRRVEDDV